MNRPLLLAAALACALAAPAAAGDARSIRVRTADLNLQSEAGAEAMLGRLERAAERACGVTTARVDLETHNRGRACVEETIADAVGSLDAPLVTALYEDRLLGGGIAQGDAQP